MAASQKSSKKRPASSQVGPTPKKAHLAKPTKGKEPAEKKRSRPVTLPIQAEDSASEDAFEELEGDLDDLVSEEEVQGDEMDVDLSNAPPKDPNGLLLSFLSPV